MDMSGFGMSMWTRKNMAVVKSAARISQDFYPEFMGKLIIVNAPMIFSAVYAIVKSWVDERTTKKV